MKQQLTKREISRIGDEIEDIKFSTVQGAVKRLCGKQIGRGYNRDVFEYKYNNRVVVKIQRRIEQFDNIKEWIVWRDLQYTEIAKFLAQPVMINETGTVFVQEKVQMLKSVKEYRDLAPRLPKFFIDTKIENFGFIDGKIKCVDYGCVIIGHGMDVNISKKVNWWSVKRKRK